jgi:hypothetical protein
MTVTRDVITDLWPIYEGGEASEATRTLVEEFLAGDPEFARALQSEHQVEAAPIPALPEDQEARTLERLKRRLRGFPWLLQLSMVATMLAFGRIVSDTSWDVSPRLFIIHCIVAAILWTAYLVTLFRGRRSVVIRWK